MVGNEVGTSLAVWGRLFRAQTTERLTKLGRLGWFRLAGEPVLKMRGTEDRLVARRETLVIDCRAGIQGFGIDDYRPWVSGSFQVLADEFVLPNRVRTGRFDDAVQRFLLGAFATAAPTSSAAIGCIMAAGNRTVCPSVAPWAMPPTNSKNWVARMMV